VQQQTPVSMEPSASPLAGAGTDVFTGQEKRRIFKGMVVGELEAGFLRYSARQKLLRYAAQLGIHEFEATLLIAEAQFQSDTLEPISFEHAATISHLTQPDSWAVSLRLTFALVAAIFIDLLLIYWLFC
jgi:hypothetical protein